MQELVAEYGQAIDHGKDTGDWTRWERVFAPEVTSDYSRFMGVPPSTAPRAVLAARQGEVTLQRESRRFCCRANSARSAPPMRLPVTRVGLRIFWKSFVCWM